MIHSWLLACGYPCGSAQALFHGVCSCLAVAISFQSQHLLDLVGFMLSCSSISALLCISGVSPTGVSLFQHECLCLPSCFLKWHISAHSFPQNFGQFLVSVLGFQWCNSAVHRYGQGQMKQPKGELTQEEWCNPWDGNSFAMRSGLDRFNPSSRYDLFQIAAISECVCFRNIHLC